MLSLLERGVGTHSGPSCLRDTPRLAELAYKLIYLLAANKETFTPTLRYLRTTRDFLYRQLQHLPFTQQFYSMFDFALWTLFSKFDQLWLPLDVMSEIKNIITLYYQFRSCLFFFHCSSIPPLILVLINRFLHGWWLLNQLSLFYKFYTWRIRAVPNPPIFFFLSTR